MGTLMAKLAEELKQVLRSYGLPLSGRKKELAKLATALLTHELREGGDEPAWSDG